MIIVQQTILRENPVIDQTPRVLENSSSIRAIYYH